MSLKLLGVDILETSSVPKHELGLIVTDVRGGTDQFSFKEVIDGTLQFRRFSPDAEYKYVKNEETNTLNSGEAVTLAISTTPTTFSEPGSVVRASVPTSHPIEGIAIVNIPTLGFGFIQIKGRVPVGVSSANAPDRLGVKVKDTNVAQGEFLQTGTVAGVLEEFTTVAATNFDGAQQIQTMVRIAGRSVMVIDSATGTNSDLDPGGGTDIRKEVYLFK